MGTIKIEFPPGPQGTLKIAHCHMVSFSRQSAHLGLNFQEKSKISNLINVNILKFCICFFRGHLRRTNSPFPGLRPSTELFLQVLATGPARCREGGTIWPTAWPTAPSSPSPNKKDSLQTSEGSPDPLAQLEATGGTLHILPPLLRTLWVLLKEKNLKTTWALPSLPSALAFPPRH